MDEKNIGNVDVKHWSSGGERLEIGGMVLRFEPLWGPARGLKAEIWVWDLSSAVQYSFNKLCNMELQNLGLYLDWKFRSFDQLGRYKIKQNTWLQIMILKYIYVLHILIEKNRDINKK